MTRWRWGHVTLRPRPTQVILLSLIKISERSQHRQWIAPSAAVDPRDVSKFNHVWRSRLSQNGYGVPTERPGPCDDESQRPRDDTPDTQHTSTPKAQMRKHEMDFFATQS